MAVRTAVGLPQGDTPPVRARAGESLYRDAARRLRKNRAAMAGVALIALLAVTALFAPLIAPYDPLAQNMPDQLQRPSAEHWLGTDEFGRDMFSRVVYGSRVTLEVGVISVVIGLGIGVVVGAASGYYGGWADLLVMRAMDVMLAFPSILLAIAIMAVLGPGIKNAMIAVGVVAVPTYARLVRGSMLAARQHEYVEAARALGAGDFAILGRHLLPNTLAPIIVQATLGLGYAVLEAAALGFLGLGAQRPHPEWGLMLADGQKFLWNAPHLATFPGLAIMLTVLGFNLLGDGLRDALDPRLR